MLPAGQVPRSPGRADLGRVWTTQHFAQGRPRLPPGPDRRGFQGLPAARAFGPAGGPQRAVHLPLGRARHLRPSGLRPGGPGGRGHRLAGASGRGPAVALAPGRARRWPGGPRRASRRPGGRPGGLCPGRRASTHPTSPLSRAEALIDHGSFLLRQGDTARARPVLAEALRLADACGAAWHAEQAEGALAAGRGSGAGHPVWRPHPPGAGRRRPGPVGANQQGDRRAAVPLREHGGDPPGSRVPQARHQPALGNSSPVWRTPPADSPAGETVWRRSHRIPGRPGELRPAHFGHAGGQPRPGARRLRRRTRPG